MTDLVTKAARISHKRERKMTFWRLAFVLFLAGGFSVLNNFICRIGVDADATGKLTPTDVIQIKEYVKETNPEFTNYTYDQLKQFFESQTPEHFKWEVYPRLYPFCVTSKHVADVSRTAVTDHLYKFLGIFEDIERVDQKFYNFDKMNHSTVFNKQWVKSISLTRINTPEMDMVNLRQWLHIRVQMVEPMKGLYMQTIVGPMGLPFGEFNMDFPCQDDLPGTHDMNTVGQLAYCSYRPRQTIQHPQVYVGYDPKGNDDFHMHFSWTDITCMETPYLQFLMLIVKEFDYNSTTNGSVTLGTHYMPLLSPVYLNTDFDSKSGAPFPYYPDWENQMYCFLNDKTLKDLYTKNFPGETWPYDTRNAGKVNKYPSTKVGADAHFAKINWVESNDTYRIQANEVYDACITGNSKDMSTRDDERLECPPGPFHCNSSYGKGTGNQVTEERINLTLQESSLADCFPCGPPPCLELGFPDYKCDNKADEITTEFNESTELNSIEGIRRAKSHGMQAIFAFLILIPLANFMARFYKEMCSHCMCDNGPWIFVHIVAHILSLLWMWVSVAPVMPALSEINQQRKQCKSQFPDEEDKADYRQCISELSASNPHVPLALIAFVMQHLLVFFGFWRSSNDKIRNIQTTLHSHFGYCCWLAGAIASILAGLKKGSCPDILITSCLMLITPFMFSAVGVALDCLLDKKVGIIPPRRQWPVLETVKLEGRSPFSLPKWIIFGLFTGCMVFFWLLLVGSSFTILGKSEDLFKDKRSKLSGIFGDCDTTRQKATKAKIT